MSRARDIADGKFANDLTVDTNTLKVDSTNNRVGLGNTAPETILHATASSAIIRLTSDANGTSGVDFGDSDDTNIGRLLYDNSDNSMRFTTNASEQMRIDAGGSVLLGTTTPTDLHNTWRHIIVGDKGAIISQDGAGGVPGMTIADNAYVDADTGGFAYQTTDQASKLTQEAGVLTFSNAGSGTAGAALSLTERLRIDNGGSVRINTTANQVGSGEILSVSVGSGGVGAGFAGTATDIMGIWHKSAGGGKAINFFSQPAGNNVGNITLGTSSTAYNTSSDYRIKQGVEDMTGAIDRVKSLSPKRFQFIGDADTTVDGFLAHEAQAVVPEAVTGTHNEVETWTQQEIDDGDAPDGTSAGDNKLDSDGNTIPVMQGIDQSKLVPLLTAALKEAITKIETLETQRADLEARLTALENA